MATSRQTGTIPTRGGGDSPARTRLLLVAALGVGVVGGLSVGVAGVLVLAATAAFLVCVALVTRRDWMAPALMFVGAAVPSGYPFELSFRIPLHLFDVSPPEGLLALALLAALVAPASSLIRQRCRLTAGARVALLGVGLAVALAVLVGFAYGQSPRDMARDLRPLFLYSAVLLPLIPTRRVHASRLARMLVLGIAFIALLQLATVVMPSLHQFFLADRGRVWFGNGALYPLAVPLGMALAIQGRSSLQTWAWATCTLLMIAGVALSQSRSQWVATLISVAFFVVLMTVGRVDAKVLRRVAFALCALAVVALLATQALGGSSLLAPLIQSSASRLGTLSNVSQDSSFMTRSTNLDSANALILAHPILGTGLGASFVLRGGSGFVYTRMGPYFDNVPQTLLAKFGVVGAVAFAWLWVLIGRRAWGARRRRTASATAYAAAVPGLAVMTLFSSYLLTGSQILVIALAAGVLLRTTDGETDGGE